MKVVNKIYVNGKFVVPQGEETMDLFNPTNNEVIGKVILGNEDDALSAIAAAKEAFPAFAASTVETRMDYLQKLHDAVMYRVSDLQKATIEEYGANVVRAHWSNHYAAQIFLEFKRLLETFEFERTVGESKVVLEPLGVTAILTAWNSNSGSIAVKLAAAIAAGCTTVIKPSEMSALQTQVLMECFHEAGLPAGIINVINGRGEILGPVLSTHKDIAKIAFTGSTQVGKIIARNAVDTMKRLTLELSGKCPYIILDDADLSSAVPMAVNACFNNNGQACISASRLLVPEKQLEQVKKLVLETVKGMKVGDPNDETTALGPLANEKQYQRVQHYIRGGLSSGAEMLIGGLGKPEGLEVGNFAKPTVFYNVSKDMEIAKDEIFGPVLSIIAYATEEEAIDIANDTDFGLLSYINSSDAGRASLVASKLKAGRVLINTLKHDPNAPFGGFKQSGLNREGGIYGLEAQLEPKAIIS